jgi:hypothetical protein
MRKIFIYKNKTKSKIKTITKKHKRNLKKGTTMKIVGGKLCNPKTVMKNDKNNKNDNIEDIYDKGKIIYSSTYFIYEDKNNPDILIKQIGPEYNYFNYLLKKIDDEIDASKVAAQLNIGPKIYYSTVCIDPTNYEKIIGYIVMERIYGKNIDTKLEVDNYIDDIFNKISLLYDNGIYYNDFHKNNFIIENKTNKLYIIDYGEICDINETYCEKYTKEEIKKNLYLSLMS